MKLKSRLKELRARDGLNQTELAKLAGISRQTISLLERDEYTPSIIIAFVANVSMMIGTLLGWFHILDSNYFFWTSLILSFVFERVEKKVKERV